MLRYLRADLQVHGALAVDGENAEHFTVQSVCGVSLNKSINFIIIAIIIVNIGVILVNIAIIITAILQYQHDLKKWKLIFMSNFH